MGAALGRLEQMRPLQVPAADLLLHACMTTFCALAHTAQSTADCLHKHALTVLTCTCAMCLFHQALSHCCIADHGQAAASQASAEQALEGNASTHAAHVAQPILYSKVVRGADAATDKESGPLNLRPSWLAGRAVHGDALLSMCRLSYAQVGAATLDSN